MKTDTQTVTRKELRNQTTSFSIAQYILFFLIIIACIALVTWTLISTSRQIANANTDEVLSVTETNTDNPCVTEITNIVSQVWAYSPESIPMQYLTMANNIFNEKLTTRYSGVCNGIKFKCQPNQIRRECDPCAASYAQEIAMAQQISDMTEQYCTGK